MQHKYLTRKEAAEYVNSRGCPVSHNTLQKYATTGGGPNYRIFGTRALYITSDLDAWIEQKLSAPRSSTSAA